MTDDALNRNPVITQEPPGGELPLAYQAVRGGMWVALSSYLNIGFGFAANLILTRILAPEHFGIFAYGTFIFSFLNLRLRVPSAYGFARQKELTGQLVGSNLGLNAIWAVGSFLLAGLASILLLAVGQSPEVVWLMLALAGVGFLDCLTDTAAALMDRELQFKRTSLVTGISFPLSYLPAIWLALHGAGFWSLVAQNAVYAFLIMVGIWYSAWRTLPQAFRLHWRFDRRVALSLARFGFTVGLASLAGLLVGQFDNFLVGTFAGMETLGFYDRAYRIAQWPTVLVTSVITKVAYYTYAKLQDDPVRLSKTVTMTFWMITALGLPLALSVFIAAPEAIAVLYGERWLPSTIFLRFLVIYAVIQPLLGDASLLLVAVGKPELTVRISAAEAATLVTVGTALTLRFGAVGTAAAVGVTFLVGLIMTYRYVIRVVKLALGETLGWPLLSTILTIVLYYVIIQLVDVNIWPPAVRLVAKAVYATVAYFGLMLAARPKLTIERALYVWSLARRGRSAM